MVRVSRAEPRKIRALVRRRSDGYSLCRAPDTTPQRFVLEVNAIRYDERRRQPQSRHCLIATCQEPTNTRHRKIKNIVPFPNERVTLEVLRAAAERNPGLFDQRRVATDLSRNKPMHHQLRGVVHAFLVDLTAHGLDLISKGKIADRRTFPLRSGYQFRDRATIPPGEKRPAS